MKKHIIIIIFLFLPLAQLIAQNKKNTTAMVMIKNQVKPPPPKIDYMAELKKLENSNPNKISNITKLKEQVKAPPPKIDYMAELKKLYKSNPNKNSEKEPPSKINYMAELKKLLGIKNPPQVKSESKNYSLKMNTLAGEMIPKKKKKTGRVVIISQAPKTSDTTEVELIKELDLSFNMPDYESVTRWAQKNGKVSLIPVVMARYGDIIKSLSHEFEVDYRVIVAICVHESGGDSWVVSWAGAAGLMQLMPGTAACYGVYGKDVFDPYTNLRAGIHYYSDMLKMFGNNKDAIYAYGIGHGAARKRLNKGAESDKSRPVQEVLYLTEMVK